MASMKLKLDLHDIYNRGGDIDRALRAECGHLFWLRLVRFSSLVLAPPSGVVVVAGGVSSSVLAPPLSE
jgi:hypothetical protein